MNQFEVEYRHLVSSLMAAPVVQVGEWQSMDTGDSKPHRTYELLNRTVRFHVPETKAFWDAEVKPDQPWAEEHFGERVSGIPHNPPPSHIRWPYGYTDRHQDPTGQFDHTYPERFWPRRSSQVSLDTGTSERQGIRFRYGDLRDVVDLLVKRPLTRQAYLPIFFPEDTGAHANQRVPCTLGYHFIIRDGVLHCVYYIRSCDIYRHFRNDVYFAGRLMQWITEQLNKAWQDGEGSWGSDPVMSVQTGTLTMHITSLHLFVGDVRKVARDYQTQP